MSGWQDYRVQRLCLIPTAFLLARQRLVEAAQVTNCSLFPRPISLVPVTKSLSSSGDIQVCRFCVTSLLILTFLYPTADQPSLNRRNRQLSGVPEVLASIKNIMLIESESLFPLSNRHRSSNPHDDETVDDCKQHRPR
jgi:hypothetical protein